MGLFNISFLCCSNNLDISRLLLLFWLFEFALVLLGEFEFAGLLTKNCSNKLVGVFGILFKLVNGDKGKFNNNEEEVGCCGNKDKFGKFKLTLLPLLLLLFVVLVLVLLLLLIGILFGELKFDDAIFNCAIDGGGVEINEFSKVFGDGTDIWSLLSLLLLILLLLKFISSSPVMSIE
ncbi:unnamed protein product [[Candida] boidinii]|nr:unnamed protein product [[Candida] boidinii]